MVLGMAKYAGNRRYKGTESSTANAMTIRIGALDGGTGRILFAAYVLCIQYITARFGRRTMYIPAIWQLPRMP